MYLTDQFCYLEMMRSGSTHVHRLFKKFVPYGKQIGHHGPPSKEIIDSKRIFVGSIRNPWTWYLSVWSFGCENGGHLHYRLTEKKIYFDQLGFKLNPILFPYVFFQQFFKPLQKWRLLFSDSDNYDNFRSFIKLIYSNKRVYDLGDGYGFSPMHKFSGLMTYYYVSLHSSNRKSIFTNEVDNFDKLKKFDKNKNLLNFTIKNESLEDDFFNFLKDIKINVDEKKIQDTKKLDKSSKSLKKNNLNYYYDKECRELVQNKEKLIIDKYNYKYRSH